MRVKIATCLGNSFHPKIIALGIANRSRRRKFESFPLGSSLVIFHSFSSNSKMKERICKFSA
jgi:hypothetical protein